MERSRSRDDYDRIKERFARERDLRLGYRPEGTAQYTSELTGVLAKYAIDPYATAPEPREPLNDTVECLFIGGGLSALMTAARLREHGVESIRIVERGADVGGTWYWNRYPGVACDVVSYDYLPLLDEMGYVPCYYNFEGELQRRQDGNYNGTYSQYIARVTDVGDRMEDHFLFTAA